jgi:4-diphosphocytidyl-2-C-methyl-D-erythritol kinase
MTRAPGFAPAKVNLFLHVTGRRDDGYHLLDSLVVFADVGDEVRADPGDGLSLAIEGEEGSALESEADNLVLRAARALASEAGIVPRAALRLSKRLPVASGIGGGSADAAAALRVLDAAWSTSLGHARLARIGLSLGADVPACLASVPVRMGGIGEVLAPAPGLPPFGILLANPRVALATPAVFAARRGGFSAPAALPAGWPDAAAMARDLAAFANDLEAAAIALRPEIATALRAIAELPGCLLARMSGSGATCFGIFADPAAAARAAEALPRGWWRWGVGLR